MERIKKAVELAKANRLLLGEDRIQESRPQANVAPRSSSASSSRSTNVFVSGDGLRLRFDPRHLKAMRVVADDVADPRGRGFEMLRSQVFRQIGEKNHQTLGVTSPTSGCGKTLCAVNLALCMARLPEKTITLVDLDLRRPNVATYLGLPPGPDIVDVLRGRAPVEDIVVVPELGNGRFRVLPTFRASSTAGEHIASRELNEMVQILRAQDPSGVIIFDLPPVLAVDDVISFLPQLDSILLVVASGQTTVSDITNSERLLGSTGIMGLVLNKSEEKVEAGYSY